MRSHLPTRNLTFVYARTFAYTNVCARFENTESSKPFGSWPLAYAELIRTRISEVAARLTTKYGDPAGDDPDLQLVFEGLSATCCRTCAVGELADPDNPDSRKSIRITSDNIKPKSRGYIGLHTSNPLDAPLMQPNYLAEADDVKILIEGIRVIQSLGNTTVLREKYGTELIKENYGDCEEQYTYDSDEFWECAVRYATGPENHQAGSCKMGPASDPLAVVDPELQVHGIEGLRVADASVMPVLISGNPHATIVMIGERAADFIKQKQTTTY
ncbi:hypothetical protein Zmor_015495 [Zophobas morio]|uniref:Glucose-methanol-choline oxidoreductase C-terminal domain-containing protein n=1 Tax=Zophobas morio TaxID=2755281 RepID=A0AA38IH91_9CUCU|nr:hypothetical protein Zmor_015495 [Zophobas morio]